MKKDDPAIRFMCCLFIIGCCVSLSAQSIGITSPAPGVKWCKGQAQTITWMKNGTMNGMIKIRLFDASGTNSILSVIDSALNSGSFTWTPPTTLADGHYVIRVRTVDNAVLGNSSVFSVQSCQSGPVITQPGTGNLQIVQPDPSKYQKKPLPAIKFDPQIIAVEPLPVPRDHGLVNIVRGKHFGLNNQVNTPFFRRLYAENKRSGSVKVMRIESWQNEAIHFRIDISMEEDDYRLYIADHEGNDILSNRFDFRVGSEFKINGIIPGHLISDYIGVMKITLIGVNFSQATQNRFVNLLGRTPGTKDVNLKVISWADKVISTECHTPLPKGGYEVEAFYYRGGLKVGGQLWVEVK